MSVATPLDITTPTSSSFTPIARTIGTVVDPEVSE